MAGNYLSNPSPQWFDDNGNPLSGGTVAFFEAGGTSTPLDTFTDKDLTPGNENTNPLPLDSDGRSTTNVFLQQQEYNIVVKDSGGVTIPNATRDNVSNILQVDLSGLATITTYAAARALAGATLTDGNRFFIESRTVDGDGASGVFFWDASSTATDNDGTILKLTDTATGRLLRDFSGPINVKWFGATGDGTTDDATEIQAAVDTGLSVYLPEGNYICDSVIRLVSGSHIFGDGIGATRIIKNAATAASQGILYAESASSVTFITDIQINDMEIDGLVSANLFSQFQHLVSLNGVDGVLIENVKFSGSQGDGIYFGSGIAGGTTERHNHNLIVRSCLFDGVTGENRNCISVIDGDGVIFTGNHCFDWTKSTMPGAFDFEPDLNVFHVIKNVTVANNTFENIGGNVAVVAFALRGATFTTQPEMLNVSDNVFDVTSNAFAVLSNATGYARPLNVVFSGNTGKCARMMNFGDFVQGATLTGNTLNTTDSALLGFDETDQALDIVFTGNVLTGDDVGKGLVIRSGNNITVSGNVLTDMADHAFLVGGAAATLNELMIANNSVNSSTAGVEFAGGTLTNISILDNEFVGAIAPIEGSIPADTRIRGNKGYISENGAVTGAIATGATVTHGTAVTPTVINVTALDSGPTDVFVSAIGATTFVINYGGGGTHVFAWEAKIPAHFGA